MPKMKGATLISEFLVKEKIPYVFGICGHGNIGMLDGLYEVRDKINWSRRATSRWRGIWRTAISA